MDGCDALPDPEAQRRECRDELECARLQLETGNESNGHRQLARSPDSVKALVLLATLPLRGLQGVAGLSHEPFAAVISLIRFSARERLAIDRDGNPFWRFYTLWAENRQLTSNGHNLAGSVCRHR